MTSRSEVDRTGMRPQFGSEYITLPVTFDYSGGRRDKDKSVRIWAIVLVVGGILFSIVALFNSEQSLILRLLITIIVILVLSIIIRFVLLKENKIREQKILLKDCDGVLDSQSFWGIYEIGEFYPYVCRFRNGKSGVFVLLNKDVILGKFSESEFSHYEAIGDAYNISGSSNIQMCHIDYMDIIGADERIDESFLSLERVSNPDLKDLLTDIYTYQKEQMSKQITAFDTYLFLWSGNDDLSWGTVQRILSCFMEANYRSYHVLNKTEIREMAKSLPLLNDFSAETAMSRAFFSGYSNGVVPISIEHLDGSREVLNKTSKEKRIEEEARESCKKGKGSKVKNKQSTKKLSETDEIDLS